MPTVRRSRTIEASLEDLWEVLGDPHHLPRWWPRVSRVEAVDQDAFTEVLTGPSGKIVRADFKLLEQVDRQRIVWSQQVENTPFARVLRSAETEITLAGASGGPAEGHREHPSATEVTIELRQELQGFSPRPGSGSWIGGLSRFGSPLVRRAAHSTLDEALDGLERIVGGATT
ncbi:MAG: SRPBCC family protein [Solirubrobacteraceae bacterium]